MILIVGCGNLGNYLIRHIRSKTDEQILATVRNTEKVISFDNVEYIKCDITVDADLQKLKAKIGDNKIKVFYLAASHNVDYVYNHPKEAGNVNIAGLQHFFDEVTSIDGLFYASSDCVYGENNSSESAFTESAELHPINEYGRQKTEAEKLVLKYGFNVVRFSLLFGPSLSEKKNFFDKICEDLLSGKSVEMIDGMERQVISYADAARYMYELSVLDASEIPPVINICGDEHYSKYDMGCVLARKLGVPESLVQPVSEEQGSRFFSDKRASYISLDNSLLKSLLNIDEILWEVTV